MLDNIQKAFEDPRLSLGAKALYAYGFGKEGLTYSDLKKISKCEMELNNCISELRYVGYISEVKFKLIDFPE